MARLAILFSILLHAWAAVAQSQPCRLPERVASTACDLRKQAGEGGVAYGTPGEFDFYVLALSWSPTFCRQTRNWAENDWQCRKNRFGFVVHGLWPHYASGKARAWPQFCTPAAPVPEAILRRALCWIPNERRVQCEWAKHGVCSDQPTPEAYVDRIERVMNRLELPDFSRSASAPLGAIAEAFFRANRARGLTAANLRIVLTRDDRLLEVRLCYKRRLNGFKPCGETVGGLDPSALLEQKRRVWIR